MGNKFGTIELLSVRLHALHTTSKRGSIPKWIIKYALKNQMCCCLHIWKKIIELKESVFGNRMNLSVNTIGGVRYDISGEQAAYILKTLENLKKPLEELTKICRTDASIRRRTEGVGVLPKNKAIEYGVVGPVARASGIEYDVRVDNPYAA